MKAKDFIKQMRSSNKMFESLTVVCKDLNAEVESWSIDSKYIRINLDQPKILKRKLGSGKTVSYNADTGEVINVEYTQCPSKEELSKDIDELVLDDNGCINGFDCHERTLFEELFLDDDEGEY